MASKEARRVVCYCLEHPDSLKDERVAQLYELAKKRTRRNEKKALRDELV
ncbi:hypothetical protein [Enterococcus gilvus]